MTIDDLNDISYKIIGCVYRVYNQLGPGLLESVYEEALAYELNKQKLQVGRQIQIPIIYDGQSLPSSLRLDLLIENEIIVELKSVESLNNIHYKQLLTYLRLTHKKLGLLINFNTDKITNNIHRIIN